MFALTRDVLGHLTEVDDVYTRMHERAASKTESCMAELLQDMDIDTMDTLVDGIMAAGEAAAAECLKEIMSVIRSRLPDV